MNDPWNRCDVCGKFIAMADFDKGAIRHMVTPDAYGTRETWETLCIDHGPLCEVSAPKREKQLDKGAELE